MGYDRAITMFSPDGRLLQVEYAKKTVRQGSSAIGMACKDGVVLVADKRVNEKLMVAEAIEKIFPIDDHVAATASGIISDARVLIERAQVKAQQHKVSYDSAIDTLTLVKDMCSLKQVCTQSGGLRPFGVSVIVAGIDTEGPKVFETDPTGIYFQFKATAIGEGETEITEVLEAEYSDDLDVEEGIKLALRALQKYLQKNFTLDRIEAAFISKDKRVLEKVSKAKLEKLAKDMNKKK